MGSATVPEAKPITMSETEKITLKTILKKPLQAIFKKKNKKPTNQNEAETTNHKPQTPQVPNVESLKLNLEQLCLNKKENSVSDDEFKHFTVKVVDEDKTRLNSNCSEDSGFSEKEDQVELVEEFEKLDLKDDKKKKPVKVYVSRAPIRGRDERSTLAGTPYHQILQVNRNTFTGSQVIIARDAPQEPFYDSRQNFTQDGGLQMALTELQHNINNFNPQEGQIYWQTAQEYLEESLKKEAQKEDNILSDFKEIPPPMLTNVSIYTESDNNTNVEQINPIEEFENADNHLNFSDFTFEDLELTPSIFLTPPRSNENQMSPSSFNSPSPSYPYHSTIASVSTDYLLSPSRSSPNLSNHVEYESYQNITQLEDIPSCVIESEKKQKKSMKNFKQIQNELHEGFLKKACCQPRKSCKEHFKGCFEKLSDEERRNMCLRVAALDLNTAYGVLQHILLSLSKGSDQENLQFALFGVILERVLAEKPLLYLGSFGLNLLKASALRCPTLPLLTRYIVECIRQVLKSEDGKAAVDSGPVFNEVDINGDTLLSACAHRGDVCADALAELVCASPGELPLFDVHHANTEGYMPLHVACRSAGAPSLHTVHVLVMHGGADLWKGDVRGGDTALHLSVRAGACSEPLVMTLFRCCERRDWRRLAHAHNRSSATPLELARLATKSTSRQNYPTEVLDFLKKCR